jgi:pimeloyl-ACP methyl ester carboxylesterase
MLADYSGVNWTSADPHAPHPDRIELLGGIAAPTTVVVAEGVGHMVNMEAPEAANELLREVVLEGGQSPTDRADCDEDRSRGLGG